MTVFQTYQDEQLAKLLCGQNSRQAFEELYNRYWKKLLIHARHNIGSEHEAEEIVQNVFLNIWKSRESLNIKNTFYTYISACVKYEILAMLTLRKRQLEANQFIFSNTSGDLDNHIVEKVDSESTRKQLETTIQSLPDKCQLVFRLSREHGHSEKQIAQKLAISPKTVQAHMTKALKILRSSINQLIFLL